MATTRSISLRRCLLACAISAGAVAIASPAVAQPVKLGITPVGGGNFIETTMGPGERRDLAVSLGNFGDQPVAARTFAADAYTIIGGGFGARLRGEPKTGPTLWLNYQEEVLELGPRQSVTRSLSILVPAGTPAGEYISSLVLENDKPISSTEEGPGGVAINRVQRQAIAVAIAVPGPPAPALTFEKASHKPLGEGSVVSVDLSNTGNVLLKPAGAFVIVNRAGKKIDESNIAMDSFYAFTKTSIEFPMKKRLEPGRYSARLSLKDERTGLVAESALLPFEAEAVEASRIVSPQGRSSAEKAKDSFDSLTSGWGPIALGVAAAIILMVLARRIRKRRRRRRSKISIFH